MCFTCIAKERCAPETDSMFINCTSEENYWDNCPKWNVGDNEPVADSTLNDSIDISNQSFINDLWLVAPASEIIIKTSIFVPVVFWGIFGNILLLYIIFTNRRLRSPTNLLIGNMAAADLTTLLVHPWVFLVYDFFQNYQLGKFGCKTEAGLECAILLASVMNLMAISYDRVNSIVLPQEKRLTKSGAKVIMVVAWVLGFALATPLFIYRTYKERQWLDFLEKFCTEDITVLNIYWHFIITMMVWFPLGTMLVCYIALFIKLNHYEQAVQRPIKSTNVSYKKKVAKMIFIVVATFMICRLPFTAMIFYRNQLIKANHIASAQQVQNQANGVYHNLWFASRYMMIVNAAINPVIYGLASEKFRKAFQATAIARWIFVLAPPQAAVDVKVKARQRQINTGAVAATTNKIKIFFNFRGKSPKNKNSPSDTGFTNCGSNVPVIQKD